VERGNVIFFAAPTKRKNKSYSNHNMGGATRIDYPKDTYWPAGGHYAKTKSGPRWFAIGLISCALLSVPVIYFGSYYEKRVSEPLANSPYPFISKLWARQYATKNDNKGTEN